MAGLSSKVHAGVDGYGRPLALMVTGGKLNDGAMLQTVLEEIHFACPGPGRERMRLGVVLAMQGSELSTRCDKLAVDYRGAVVLCAVASWLKP